MQIAAEVSAPLAKTDEIVLIGGQDRTTAEISKLCGTLPPTVQALTGVDITGVGSSHTAPFFPPVQSRELPQNFDIAPVLQRDLAKRFAENENGYGSTTQSSEVDEDVASNGSSKIATKLPVQTRQPSNTKFKNVAKKTRPIVKLGSFHMH